MNKLISKKELLIILIIAFLLTLIGLWYQLGCVNIFCVPGMDCTPHCSFPFEPPPLETLKDLPEMIMEVPLSILVFAILMNFFTFLFIWLILKLVVRILRRILVK